MHLLSDKRCWNLPAAGNPVNPEKIDNKRFDLRFFVRYNSPALRACRPCGMFKATPPKHFGKTFF